MTSTGLRGSGDETDSGHTGVDSPGQGKAVAAVGVGAESTLVAGRTSAKSKGEEQAGTEEEMSKRSTS